MFSINKLLSIMMLFAGVTLGVQGQYDSMLTINALDLALPSTKDEPSKYIRSKVCAFFGEPPTVIISTASNDSTGLLALKSTKREQKPADNTQAQTQIIKITWKDVCKRINALNLEPRSCVGAFQEESAIKLGNTDRAKRKEEFKKDLTKIYEKSKSRVIGFDENDRPIVGELVSF